MTRLDLLAASCAGLTVGMLISWTVHSQPDRELSKRVEALKAEETVYALDAADRMLCEEQLGIRY